MMLANPDQSQKLAWLASIVREQLGEDRRGSSLFAAEKNAGGRSRRRRREQRHRRLVLLLPRKQLFGKVEEKAKNAQWFWRSYFSSWKDGVTYVLDQWDLRSFLMDVGFSVKLTKFVRTKSFIKNCGKMIVWFLQTKGWFHENFSFLQLKSKKYSFKMKVMKYSNQKS